MKKMLLKFFVTLIILVTFFSFSINSKAASFRYSDFNWDEFLEQNKNHWTAACENEEQECIDKVLLTQKEFYTTLYKLLSVYQSKGITIDDNIIIETVFYGLTPNTFRDPVVGEDNPFNLDGDNTSFIASDDGNLEEAKRYFETEKNSLKTLLNNMVGYTQKCYGISSVTPKTVDNITSCEDGNVPDGNQCVGVIHVFNVQFFKVLLGNYNSECNKLAIESGFVDSKLGPISKTPEVNEEMYWEFLLNSNYFDKKEHLQSIFSAILKANKVNSMSELTSDQYLEYEEEIKDVRRRIINGIKSVLESARNDLSNVGMMSGSNSSYWWPIGGTEVIENDGKSFASGDPESVNITSNYGPRNINGTDSFHHGIDISGTEGVTNVIAVRDGTVVGIIDDSGGLCINGDSSCGGKYGNYVIIQHIDNNYTLYAHMNTNSIIVKSGDVVKQGQVIGKLGNTGYSTGPHLHFEVRVGGNDLSSAQDPLTFINKDDPRAMSGLQSDLLEWIGVMEGTGPTEGDNYVVYNDSGGVATFGHGITIINNKDLISSFGINPDTLHVGSLVPKVTADEMYLKLVQDKMDNIKSQISAKGLTLVENQIAALVSLQYNVGNIYDFYSPYEKYGATQSLCDNWWTNYALKDQNGTYQPGLKKRRISECNAFVSGVYENPY